MLLIWFTNHNPFFMNVECCANEWCQCKSLEAEVICLAPVQEQQGWELSKPTSIYSNPANKGGYPLNVRFTGPLTPWPQSVACQQKCHLNYSANAICIWRVKEPALSFVPKALLGGNTVLLQKSPGRVGRTLGKNKGLMLWRWNKNKKGHILINIKGHFYKQRVILL